MRCRINFARRGIDNSAIAEEQRAPLSDYSPLRMHGLTHSRRQKVTAQIHRHRLTGLAAATATSHDARDIHQRHQHTAMNIVLPVSVAVESDHFQPDETVGGFGDFVIQKFMKRVGVKVDSAGHLQSVLLCSASFNDRTP